jgi:hypothetical protein
MCLKEHPNAIVGDRDGEFKSTLMELQSLPILLFWFFRRDMTFLINEVKLLPYNFQYKFHSSLTEVRKRRENAATNDNDKLT